MPCQVPEPSRKPLIACGTLASVEEASGFAGEQTMHGHRLKDRRGHDYMPSETKRSRRPAREVCTTGRASYRMRPSET